MINDFPIKKEDLAKKTIVFDLPENKQLVIDPSNYLNKVGKDSLLAIRNLSAVYYLANKQFGKYHEIINLYRSQLSQYADEATDEPTSHMLGSGEDFPYILRDLRNLKEDLKAKYQWVLEHANETNKSTFEKIWNEKLEWCDEIINLMVHGSWLDENFEYGSYKNVNEICHIYTSFDLN